MASEASLGYGAAYHPYGGSSYTHRSVQGLTGYNSGYYGHGYGHGLYKREADAEPSYGYGYPALSYHGYGGVSYEARSPQGLSGYYGHGIGKRSADAEPSLGYGGAYHPYGGSKDSPDTTPDTMDMDTDMVSTSVKLMLRLMLTTVMEAMVAHLMFLSPDLCTLMDMESTILARGLLNHIIILLMLMDPATSMCQDPTLPME